MGPFAAASQYAARFPDHCARQSGRQPPASLNPILLLPALNTDAPDGKPIGCSHRQYSALSRF